MCLHAHTSDRRSAEVDARLLFSQQIGASTPDLTQVRHVNDGGSDRDEEHLGHAHIPGASPGNVVDGKVC